MTQLTAAQAAYLNKMNPAAKKVGLGDRLRAVEGGTIATGTEAQLPICDALGVPTPQTVSGAGTLTAAGVLKISKLGAVDADLNKIFGLTSTRNALDNSMYVPVADSNGYERGVKIAFAPALNGGGYFESLFVNTKVAASMAGTLRGLESKVSVTGTANASGEVVGAYSKVNVETGATAASVVLQDLELDPEGSATITAGTGLRIHGSAKLDYGIDISSVLWKKGAIKLPFVDGNAAVSIAALESAFGTDNAKDGLIGRYKDNNDAVWLIIGDPDLGHYFKVASTEVSS